MILVGYTYRFVNCAGKSSTNSRLDDNMYCDAKAAAKTIWTISHNITSFWYYDILKAEFHDTDTNTTWSVDGNGHTQRDYRSEATENFKSRWTQ